VPSFYTGETVRVEMTDDLEKKRDELEANAKVVFLLSFDTHGCKDTYSRIYFREAVEGYLDHTSRRNQNKQVSSCT
jgi:hypothetical protein